MLYQNEEGHIDLQYEEELNKLVDKIIKAHKPENAIEFMALSNYIKSKVNYNVTMGDAESRCEKYMRRDKGK